MLGTNFRLQIILQYELAIREKQAHTAIELGDFTTPDLV